LLHVEMNDGSYYLENNSGIGSY